ncbi:MAG TPA: (Fe-S)-binding protein [Candidatus Saccharimonadales bacterium]|nr:(Fe-S)-binding protein [Candidatus Saccharimonadales bacterium]
MANENLEKVRDEVYGCSVCGQCVKGPVDPFRPNAVFHDYMPDRACPMRENSRFLTYSASGLNSIARALLEGQLQITEELAAAVSECVLCEACGTNCGEVFNLIETMIQKELGHGVDTPAVVRALRADFVNSGKGPTGHVEKVATAIDKSHNRFGRSQNDRNSWIPEGMNIPSKGELLFFVGCTASMRSKEIAQSFAKILKKADVEFAVLGEEEWCCGGPQLLNAGLVKQFEVEARHNVDAIRAAGAKEVVTTCADCYRTLKIDYPKVVGELGFSVVHSSELLARLIEQKKIHLTKEIEETVTFQDPCQLGRVAKVYEEPRSVIGNIPGVKLVEMEGNKQYTVCCGRYPVEMPEQSLETGKARIQDAKATGATTLITACSFCKWNLSKAANTLGSNIKVREITEVVAEAMGV